MSVDVLLFALVDAMLETAMRAAHDAANAAVSASVEDYALLCWNWARRTNASASGAPCGGGNDDG